MVYKIETHRDSPNFTPGKFSPNVFGYNRIITGLTIHHWGDPANNPTFDGTVNWLCRPNGNTSAHCVLEAGRVSFIVNPWDVAWATGHPKGNATTYSVEANPRASKGDIETLVEYIADFRAEHGDVMLYAHNYWQNTQCPGRYDVYELDRRSYDVLRDKHGITF